MIETVLGFWFDESGPGKWFKADDAFDREIATRFGDLHRRAAGGELFAWRAGPEGRLAEIIVLDQFSRNIWRRHAQAFACDGMALVLAQEAVARGADRLVEPDRRSFFYMPYMHSESAAIHAGAIPLFEALGGGGTLVFARRHKAVIDRFGRFPHRNEILGRPSTPEEIVYMNGGGESWGF